MGETREDRVGMIATLAGLPAHPESVPINMLVKVEGTPLAGEGALDAIEFVRTIAVARITMPGSVVRLSAGREDMSEETQALCFLAGANSIFYGPKLLTTPNPGRDRDRELMDRLGSVADGARAGLGPRSHSRGAAVRARIVAAFATAVGMQHHRAGVAHDVGIGLGQDVDVVAGSGERLDDIAVEARLEAKRRARGAPGSAEHPARPVDRVVERLARNRRSA